ncbi:hypothetical protein Tco_1031668 [Tanacetum coccineum]|uniref:Uncharacterized protein n=1 Tax=Tanacetum coccineum TaxID=301880 RepID=A0ABQ5GBY3_9ASTR
MHLNLCKPKAPKSATTSTKRTLRWQWCGGGVEADGMIDNDAMGDDDDGGGVGVVVAARGCGDRIDRLMRNTFGLGRKTRRKTFPAATAAVVAGMLAGGGGGAGYEEREEMRSLYCTRTVQQDSLELIRGRKLNLQYFHVFGFLCYPTNDRDDLGKMKPKADIGSGFNCLNFQDSLKDSQSVPSKTNLDNLFGPMYEENYATSTTEVSDNSAANTLDNEDTPLSSSIIVEKDEAPQIVFSSEELVDTEPNTLVSNENADELFKKTLQNLTKMFFTIP